MKKSKKKIASTKAEKQKKPVSAKKKEKKQLNLGSKSFWSFTLPIIAVALLAIPLTVLFLQKPQDIRQRAAEITPTPTLLPSTTPTPTLTI